MISTISNNENDSHPITDLVSWEGNVVEIIAGMEGTQSHAYAKEVVDKVLLKATALDNEHPFHGQVEFLRKAASGYKGMSFPKERAEAYLDKFGETHKFSPPWATDNLLDLAFVLHQTMRFQKPRAVGGGAGYIDNADALGEREYIQIPLSWYQHLVRSYRGSPRPYFEAIQILAYVISKYRGNRFPGDLLWVRTGFLQELFGLTKDAEEEAVRYLVENGFLIKVVIKGFVPWNPAKRGSYRYLVPVLARFREITWKVPSPEPGQPD